MPAQISVEAKRGNICQYFAIVTVITFFGQLTCF